MKNATTRFSDRVGNYVKYRPSYPKSVIETLTSDCGLTPGKIVADIGSGTGLLTRLFLENGNTVFAVEPNREMRNAAEEMLNGTPGFISINAAAEDTRLGNCSVDFIVAGQAFHWFDRERSKAEFLRILRSRGCVVLIWNERVVDRDPFSREYESVLKKRAIDYGSVDHRNIDEAGIAELFRPGHHSTRVFPNLQKFDLDGLIGRCLSSSYVPNQGAAGHAELLSDLQDLFQRYQTKGTVAFAYATRMYFGEVRG